jgi:peptidoglycan/LPS O-acetylase OafA/YrhL
VQRTALELDEARPGTRGRNRYFDLLRAAALLRVIVYHTVGWPWLHLFVPAMGVMFALAGSLMAGSLERRPPVRVVFARMRRLLPPVWVFGIVAIAMGWVVVGTGRREWLHLLFWLLPLRDPESHSVGFGYVDILWYVRTYLWFVILSPVLLMAFRKAPVATLVAPLALLPVATLLTSAGHGAVEDLLGFGTCWTLGFAAHDGFLARVSVRMCGAVVAVLAAAGLTLEIIYPFGRSGVVGPLFVGYALCSTAWVLVLMRWSPDVSWLMSNRWLRNAVAIVNARAVTIYIWHDVAIAVIALFLHAARLHVSHVAELPAVLVLTGCAVLAFGWVEDLAARRRPVLLPRPLLPRPLVTPAGG